MEAFSLLKYWRGGGGGGGGGVSSVIMPTDANVRTTSTTEPTTTTIREMAVDSDEEGDDDGPFFDLEFTVPEEENGDEEEESDNGEGEEGEDDSTGTEEEEEEEEDRDFDFTVSSGSTGSRTDQNLSLSPSDDLFFKGQFVPIEPGLNLNSSDSHSKLGSLLKPATKLRVLMLGFKKPKSEKVDNLSSSPSHHPPPPAAAAATASKRQLQNQQRKSFTVKFKVEEVPIVSLFARENSSKNNRLNKQTIEEVAEEKKFAKDVLQKYLKMVKPLYVRVSKRYGEKLDKLGFSGQLSMGRSGGDTAVGANSPANSSSPEVVKEMKKEVEVNVSSGNVIKSQIQGNLTAGLRVVCKHLGKSRSASSAVAAAPSNFVQSKRQDDSLLQQQDGIQSAILHCKRSFHASRELDSSLLSRSSSDPSHEKSKPIDKSRTSLDERKLEPKTGKI